MKIHRVLLPVLVLVLTVLTVCECKAKLEIKMLTFKNPDKMDWDDRICDPYWFGTERCDHVFQFCFDKATGDNNPTKCAYKLFNPSGEFANSETIRFDHNIHGVSNPLLYTFSSWPGSFKFKINVADDDSSHPGAVHDLVDKFSILLRKPVADRAEVLSRPKTESKHGYRHKYSYSMQTSVSFTWRVFCLENYFGADCSVYCKARDDNAGHHTCDPVTGAKLCLPGWEDPISACRVVADDCANHGCLHGSTCIDGNRTYTCSCRKGYTGHRCESEIDHCASSPCFNNGVCVNSLKGFKCTCNGGYLGERCLEHICGSDQTDPCVNGRCYGDGRCLCDPSYMGPVCNIDICQSNRCRNNATCQGGVCYCQKGFAGQFCDVDLCTYTKCSGHGNCHHGECYCDTGFEGEHCGTNVNDCTSRPCHNHGFCVDLVNGYECRCLPAYTGANCETRLVDPMDPSPPITVETMPPSDDDIFKKYGTPPPPEKRVEEKDPNNKEQDGASPVAVTGTGILMGIPIWAIILIALLVVLILVVAIVGALIVRNRKNSHSKDRQQLGRTLSNESTTSGNFENPLYSPENSRLPGQGQTSPYSNGYQGNLHGAQYHNGGHPHVSNVSVIGLNGVGVLGGSHNNNNNGHTEPIYSDPLPPYQSEKYFGAGSSNPASSELGGSSTSHYDVPPAIVPRKTNPSKLNGTLVLPSPEDVVEIPTKRPL